MRAIWKGSITFGFVNIPIGLYTATRSEQLKFHLLRKNDLSPVNYKRVAATDGKEVQWEDIVKGYEYEKGKYIVLKDDDFKRVDVEATQTVDILDFVDISDIDPMFFDKPYYLEPQRGGEKAYVLLREALKGTGKVGIAKVVIKTRQHLAAVKPLNNLLILELMHFQEELVPADGLKIPEKAQVGKKEMDMAIQLVNSLTEAWQPEKYTDEYRSALLKLIREKADSGGKTPAGATPKARKATNVIDLVQVLQQSLKHARETGESPSPDSQAKAPSKSKKKTSKKTSKKSVTRKKAA
ncbi:MAG: Ku protein [Verrucomicrobiales bacterium]